MLKLLAVTASTLALTACGQCGADRPSPDDDPDPAERALLEVAAADAFATVIMRPARWSTLRDTVAGSLPGPIGEGARGADTPWGLMSALTGGEVAVARALPSLDTKRPAAVGLFIAAQPELLEATAELSTLLDGKGFTALRHRALLPATDPSKLAAELRSLLAARGVELVDAPEPHATSFAGVYPGPDHVRLELVPEDAPPGGKPDKAWRDAWNARLSASPRAALAITAGLHRALAPDAFLSAWIDTSRMRTTAAALGATQVAAALQYVDPEVRKALLAVGTAEIMSGFSLLSPERALVHDVGLTLDAADGGLVVRSVASLTPRGRALFEPAHAAATPAVEADAARASWARAVLRLSLRDVRRAVEIPPVFADTSSSDLAQVMAECGMFCRASLHGMLVLLARALAEQPSDLQVPLPRSLSFAGAKPSAPGAPPSFALALGYASGELPKATLDRLQGDLPRGFALTSGASDGGELAYLAFDMDAKPAFKPAERGPLLSLDLDLDGLSELLDAAGMDRLPHHGRLSMRTDLTGAALSSSLALHDKGDERPLAPIDYARFDAPKSPALTPAIDCLERAVYAVASSWKSIEQAPPEMRAAVATKSRASIEAPLACADADATTKASAAILRKLLTRF